MVGYYPLVTRHSVPFQGKLSGGGIFSAKKDLCSFVQGSLVYRFGCYGAAVQCTDWYRMHIQ